MYGSLALRLHRSLRFLARQSPHYARMMRLDRPIGIYLLLWPTLWALWLAAGGFPQPKLLGIFVVGVVVMRSAGCVINDLADRDFDRHVARTRDRPLARGDVSPIEALVVFTVLVSVAFLLVLMTNVMTLLLAGAGLAITALYPLMKRITHLPQVLLGVAFSWPIPMAFAAEMEALPAEAWLAFVANMFWIVAYDTEYAMSDREDDLKIGIKSTAILFGRADRAMVAVLQILAVVTLVLLARRIEAHPIFYGCIATACALFAYQHVLIRGRERQRCFEAFLHNNWVGMIVFIGIVLNFAWAADVVD